MLELEGEQETASGESPRCRRLETDSAAILIVIKTAAAIVKERKSDKLKQGNQKGTKSEMRQGKQQATMGQQGRNEEESMDRRIEQLSCHTEGNLRTHARC